MIYATAKNLYDVEPDGCLYLTAVKIIFSRPYISFLSAKVNRFRRRPEPVRQPRLYLYEDKRAVLSRYYVNFAAGTFIVPFQNFIAGFFQISAGKLFALCAEFFIMPFFYCHFFVKLLR